MLSSEIRKKFLDYFAAKDHLTLPSSSLIPHNDPTLMFNNAGMNQFKNVFLGTEKAKHPRATTAQKCVRAGGKHNDLDNVGFTARHHTFFEMMGNFSFGDYFKEEAILFAWEFLTETLGLDKSKLYITAFHDDKEAKDLWLNKMNIPKSHFSTFGEKDNFWRMGDVGPCGPCSEIFYDFGPEMGTGPQDVVGGDGDRFIEIWNLVFMQFNENDCGQSPLPNPSIDTGMGLERISMVMQNTKSNYETDLFLPTIDLASKLTQTSYDLKNPNESKDNAALRVLADHSRSVSFLIADGVLPSNEGRGYVLRRILRRAVRFNRKLNDSPILSQLCESIIEQMSPFYPELKERAQVILQNVKDEEDKFLQTLDKGEVLLDKELSKISGSSHKTLDGQTAFKLYDTFGFPADLTEIILKEKGFKLDQAGFDKALLEAKEKAKSQGKKGAVSFKLPDSLKDSLQNLEPTEFTGYENTSDQSEIIELHTQNKVNEVTSEDFYFVSRKTPFYAESGGQVGDTGFVSSSEGSAKIIDVKKLDHLFVHQAQMISGQLKAGDQVNLKVDSKRREKIKQNHSATHLMHAALIKVCGANVQQAGSLVDESKLRFDFNHKGPVSKTDLAQVESLVNEEIKKSERVLTELMSIESAKAAGAQALFGEKYDDQVRVLSMGDFSKELCGGTHVDKTSEIQGFKIISETGVSSGVRRIEAITGEAAFDYLSLKTLEFETISKALGLPMSANSKEILQQFEKLNDEVKTLKKKLKGKNSSQDIETQKIQSQFGEIEFCVSVQEDMDRNDLRDAADRARDKMKLPGLCVFVGQKTDKGFPVLVSRTKDLKDLNAGGFLKSLTAKLGGKGGGRPDFAQGTLETHENLTEVCKALI